MAIFNPFVPSFKENPYLQYARLRQEGAVHRSEALQAWIVTGYRECRAVLGDAESFSSDGANAGGQLGQTIREERAASPLGAVQTLLTVDPPVHARLRGVISRAFTPRRVAELEPRIESIGEGLLDRAGEGGEFDLVSDFAGPLPVVVIAELLGIPAGDRDRFRAWSNQIAATTDLFGVRENALRARESTKELIDYFDVVIAERRRERQRDLLSDLIDAEERDQRLNHQEILAFAILLLVAGVETTTNLIGNGMLALTDHPEALERLREAPAEWPPAIEEMLRYDSPVQGVIRIARRDVMLGSQAVAAGDLLLLMLGGANRDPAEFPHPDRFDLAREPRRHLAFGLGPHFCLGAPLARLEAVVALRVLCRRFPMLEMGGEAPQRGGTLLLRGLKSFPMAVVAGREFAASGG